jgi:hypothetical protein
VPDEWTFAADLTKREIEHVLTGLAMVTVMIPPHRRREPIALYELFDAQQPDEWRQIPTEDTA